MITKEDMENFYFRYIVRKDLDGDPLLALNLLDAANDKDWQRVETLLTQGADPRICRKTDGTCVESALACALAARRYDIARKLFDAGDRLDDHRSFTDAEWDGEIIDFFAGEMREGRNYFFDGSKSFDEYCKSSNFAQIEKMLTAFQSKLANCSAVDRAMILAELNSGFIALIHSAVQYPYEIDKYIPLLEKFLETGASVDSDEDADELAFHIQMCLVIRSQGKTLIKKQNSAQEKLLTILRRTPVVNNEE